MAMLGPFTPPPFLPKRLKPEWLAPNRAPLAVSRKSQNVKKISKCKNMSLAENAVAQRLKRSFFSGLNAAFTSLATPENPTASQEQCVSGDGAQEFHHLQNGSWKYPDDWRDHQIRS
ncbi:hypothetical protein EH240_33540 [Mesorhizobium tamadayense]|uniref:Uncharacterized protein n=1 Tax=Mesorhizobium tamadayense TaxID=425306 RepID=A0A3P3EUI1_9HYPH|nr:hypothetical protein [Mesorhizobium tamadayense]RRH90054.1 hypothetical protein EH240_33540 [Mesorhizobium tamadayense]